MTHSPELLKKMIFRLFKKKAQDQRNNCVVAMIECILNQNARDPGAATYPAMSFEVIGLCMKYHVGMVQIPCPEIACLGFLRKREPGQSIREVLDTETGRECCRMLAQAKVLP
jgi:predicted secreted protein